MSGSVLTRGIKRTRRNIKVLQNEHQNKQVLYMTDLDRTLIFSYRYIEQNNVPENIPKVAVEFKKTKPEEALSYMAESVQNKLIEINKLEGVSFIPTTTRSVEEYKRVYLGFEPEWAITSNGGCILHYGEQDKDYRDYVRSKLDFGELTALSMDLSDLESINHSIRVIDGCYLFTKTSNEQRFDAEAEHLSHVYTNWDFTRQEKKCYMIPKHFSKQVAARWLWNKLGKPYIVASGDNQLDLPLLALADKAVVPENSFLMRDGFIEEATVVTGGIESPLKTMEYVVDALNNNSRTEA